jgi:hypothetical protein
MKPAPKVTKNNLGLDREALRVEVRRLRAQGWQTWEIRERFDLSILEAVEKR